jgi:DNA-directed RNA polymerase delta subunit
MKRTKEEIATAIEKIKDNKTKCAKFNFFGENNHDKIDAMLDVLENNRSEDYIYNHYPSEDEDGEEDTISHGLWGSAIIALEFMRGENELKDLLYPEI